MKERKGKGSPAAPHTAGPECAACDPASSYPTPPSPSPDEERVFVARLVETHGRSRRAVIPILQAVQEKYRCVPDHVLKKVCEITDITPAWIAGVSTFYSRFRQKPAGLHTIKVCVGTACHIKGAEKVFDAFTHHLGIPEGEDTDPGRLFTVEKAACLGCCMLAPAIQIDDLKYGFLDPHKVPSVLRDFLESANRVEKRETAGRRGKEVLGALPRGALPPGATPGATPGAQPPTPSGEIRLCLCSSCSAAGAGKVYDELVRRTKSLGLPVDVKVAGCTGISYEAPFIEVALRGGALYHYGRIGPQNVDALLARHFTPKGLGRRVFAAGRRILENLLTDDSWEPVTRYSVDLTHGTSSLFWGPQTHVVTEGCGSLDPLDLDAYTRNGGFEALKKCLFVHTPQEIIGEIERSGLRGKGGAGYPTGLKWASVRNADGSDSKGAQKYLICNGDEGDPGAFMDRMVLESFPFRVIEGMAIAARAVGAAEGFLYVRAEYPLAISRVREALAICEERGVLGDSMMGSGLSLRLTLVQGAGAFVAGEETALIAAIEGRRGMPSYRPPYPNDRGLWGKPTLVNNVETFASVPWIIARGADAFARMGTARSKGTKTFALAGKIARGGLIEVPMGMTLREIVETIGGGIQGGKALKAVQVGGPSGGCVPASLADTRVDFDALAGAGAIMGSGGLVVLDESDCMVDIARYFMTFTQSESCGKCTCCRVGTKVMLDTLERLCGGEGKQGDIEELERLAWLTQAGSLCGLGRTAPNPVLSTLKHFRGEYEAHLKGSCPAGKCKKLITYQITDDCIGCTRCAQRCPAGAIAVKPYERHEIDAAKCVRCGTCAQVCRVGAVKVG
jgi:NADH-quinone oxidoreductase subunit F